MKEPNINKSPRDFTREERRLRFLTLKAKLTKCEAERQESTVWHQVDDPLTPEQYGEVPPGRPGISGRTEMLWVKYRHHGRREMVVAQGWFDHEDARWRAQYHGAGDGDYVCVVEAVAWAYITPGVLPWDGPVV